ncbi:MAG: hypothetical protein AB1813_08995 [Verrucomicrobiota bacterium]
MIQLHPDVLVFQTEGGQGIPCSAEVVAVELVGASAAEDNAELLRQAAAAVLHYFKHDLGKTTVALSEFTKALEFVLRELGFSAAISQTERTPSGSDLGKLLSRAGASLELGFFPLLREELRRQLRGSPELLQFHGLRNCVKKMTGARRWNQRCQELSDQIVEFLRTCLEREGAFRCGLMVR